MSPRDTANEGEPAPKLVVQGLYKIFGDHPDRALKMLRDGQDKSEIFEKTGQTVGVMDATFTVNEGEIFVIMGLSGSGKSTLVRLLNRLIEPTAGEILVNGRDITAMSQSELRQMRRRDMAMVFQSFALMPHLKVIDNAAFGLELGGTPRAERHARALEALEAVGLKAWADSYPGELSGGMQQRVGLARALANDPSVLLMDEAFSALDPLIRSEMQDELLRLQSEQARTIVFISHDLDEAMRIGDRIAIMEGGRIIQIGTPDEILRNPADDYVASFFRGVDVSKVLTAGAICRRPLLEVAERADQGVRTAAQRLKAHDFDHAVVVDRKRRYLGMVSVDSLARTLKDENPAFTRALLPDTPSLAANQTVAEVLGVVADAPHPLAVVAEDGRYLGVVSKSILLRTLDRETETTYAEADHTAAAPGTSGEAA